MNGQDEQETQAQETWDRSLGVNREEHVNAELAACLRTMHPRWNVRAEMQGLIGGARRPDIVITQPNSLPVILETEFLPARDVDKDARRRLGSHLGETEQEIEQCIAVRLPEDLRRAPQERLRELLQVSEFEYAAHTLDAEGTALRWPEEGWLAGGISALADCAEIVALSESRIAGGVKILQETVRKAAGLLGATQPQPVLAGFSRDLHQEAGEQTNRMAAAVIANAVMFHRQLAPLYDEISSLEEIKDAFDGVLLTHAVMDSWRDIRRINYWPIFSIASRLLRRIAAPHSHEILRRMHVMTEQLSLIGAAGVQDLSGRMFQTLIADRRFLATFYTLPSSAALLAELAVHRLAIRWADRESVAKLRVADFACGTGALLGATYSAIASRHRRAGGDDAALHDGFMERGLTGIDIMPAASHLTATVLAGAHPDRTFSTTRIAAAAFGAVAEEEGGGPEVRIGSLELLNANAIRSLFGDSDAILRGDATAEIEDIVVPDGSMDLVIMNPPFTRAGARSVEGAPRPSFAAFGTSEEVQSAMDRRLKRFRQIIRRSSPTAGHGNAGIAADFIDLAHAKLKPGGVLALVLPAAFLQGTSWQKARVLLERFYEDVTIICISAAESAERSFSADTGIAESLIIAKRVNGAAARCVEREWRAGLPTESRRVFVVNLKNRPRSLLEAKETAKNINGVIRHTTPETGAERLEEVPGNLNGSMFAAPRFSIAAAVGGIRSSGVAKAASELDSEQGPRLQFPRMTVPISTEVCPLTLLGGIGKRGLYHLDISGRTPDGGVRGPFDVDLNWESFSEYPVLWNHNAESETRLTVQPDRQGRVRRGCLAQAVELWSGTATRLHLNLDFQLNSQPLAACLTAERSIGGRAWPSFVTGEWVEGEFHRRTDWEIPVLLWMNTTIGLISFWYTATRQQQGRAILTISLLDVLPCLDVRQLSNQQIEQCDQIFDGIQGCRFLPANEAYHDPSRKRLDEEMLGGVLGIGQDLLGEEYLGLLRRQWCMEPSVHGGKQTRPRNG